MSVPGLGGCACNEGGSAASADLTGWGFTSRSIGEASLMTTSDWEAILGLLALIISESHFSNRLYRSESACSLGLEGGSSISAQKNSSVRRWHVTRIISNYPSNYPKLSKSLRFSRLKFALYSQLSLIIFDLSHLSQLSNTLRFFQNLIFRVISSFRGLSLSFMIYLLHMHVADK